MKKLFLILICVGSSLFAGEHKLLSVASIIEKCKDKSDYQSCNFLRIYIDKFYPVMCGHQGYVGMRYTRIPSHISSKQEDTCRQISDALSDMEFASKILDMKFTKESV